MKTEQKQVRHTPGPWRIGGDSIETTIEAQIIAPANEVRLVPMVTSEIIAQVISDDDEEQQANARLIAAAPELLAACKWVHSTMHEIADDGQGITVAQAQQIFARLRSAIARAEGSL